MTKTQVVSKSPCPLPTDVVMARHCPWMLEARSLLGQREIPGPQTADFISSMLRQLHAWWTDDETPWCGAFVAHCLRVSGSPTVKQWWRARGWDGFGTKLSQHAGIPYGALVVLNRPPRLSDGHVGFFAARAEFSDGPGVSLLAGNQDNMVCYRSFPMRRVLYVGWPTLLAPGELPRQLWHMARTAPPAAPSQGEA